MRSKQNDQRQKALAKRKKRKKNKVMMNLSHPLIVIQICNFLHPSVLNQMNQTNQMYHMNLHHVKRKQQSIIKHQNQQVHYDLHDLLLEILFFQVRVIQLKYLLTIILIMQVLIAVTTKLVLTL